MKLSILILLSICSSVYAQTVNHEHISATATNQQMFPTLDSAGNIISNSHREFQAARLTMSISDYGLMAFNFSERTQSGELLQTSNTLQKHSNKLLITWLTAKEALQSIASNGDLRVPAIEVGYSTMTYEGTSTMGPESSISTFLTSNLIKLDGRDFRVLCRLNIWDLNADGSITNSYNRKNQNLMANLDECKLTDLNTGEETTDSRINRIYNFDAWYDFQSAVHIGELEKEIGEQVLSERAQAQAVLD